MPLNNPINTILLRNSYRERGIKKVVTQFNFIFQFCLLRHFDQLSASLGSDNCFVSQIVLLIKLNLKLSHYLKKKGIFFSEDSFFQFN